MVYINRAYLSGRYSCDVQAKCLSALWLHFPAQRGTLCNALCLLPDKGVISCFMALYCAALAKDAKDNAGLSLLLDASLPIPDTNKKSHDFSSQLFTALRHPAAFGAFIRASAELLTSNKVAADIAKRLSAYAKNSPMLDKEQAGKTLLFDLLKDAGWRMHDQQASARHQAVLTWLMAAYPPQRVVEFLVYYPPQQDAPLSYLLQALEASTMLSVIRAFLTKHAALLLPCRGLFDKTLACLLDRNKTADSFYVSTSLLLLREFIAAGLRDMRIDPPLPACGDYLDAGFYRAILKSGVQQKGQLLHQFIALSQFLPEEVGDRAWARQPPIVTQVLLCDLLVFPEKTEESGAEMSKFIQNMDKYFPGLLHYYLDQPYFVQNSMQRYQKEYGSLKGYTQRLQTLIKQAKTRYRDSAIPIAKVGWSDTQLHTWILTSDCDLQEKYNLLKLLLQQMGRLLLSLPFEKWMPIIQPKWVAGWINALPPTCCMTLFRHAFGQEREAQWRAVLGQEAGFLTDLFDNINAQLDENRGFEAQQLYAALFCYFLPPLPSSPQDSEIWDGHTATLYEKIATSQLEATHKAHCLQALLEKTYPYMVATNKQILPVDKLIDSLPYRKSKQIFDFLSEKTEKTSNCSPALCSQMIHWKGHLNTLKFSQNDDGDPVLNPPSLGHRFA